MRWSLDELYSGFDSEKFAADLSALRAGISGLREWTAGGDAVAVIEEYIRRLQDISRYYTLPIYARLVLSVDGVNEKALKISDMLDELFTEMSEPSVRFNEFIGKLDGLDELIGQSELLTEHAFMLRNIRDNYKYLLSDKEELVIAKLRTTGSTAWTGLFEQLTSTLTADMDGKRLPLSVVRDMAHEPDADLRKRAYEAELKSYEKIDKALAFALNSIKGEVITTCRMRGYESPLSMTLINSHMDRETLESMFSALKDALPMFRKYYRKKAELLGHPGGLPFYDIAAPMGDVEMKFGYDEAKTFVIENFRSFSDRLGDFAENAFKNGWVDAEPREGKQGGAFCMGIHELKQSRILCNFTGSLNNVLTIAHELGHGYHGHCLRDMSALNADYPMPIAETASNLCEIILTDAALGRADSRERKLILEQSISDAAQVTVDIYSRFLFETKVFENRVDGGLSVNELKSLMLEAQKEAYGDGLNPELMHPYMWACKTHYYHADYNFYNFPYAYGMLFARGLYADYLRDKPTFVEKYDDILKATGCNNLRDVGLRAGIDVRSREFWESSFGIIARDIEEWIGE